MESTSNVLGAGTPPASILALKKIMIVYLVLSVLLTALSFVIPNPAGAALQRDHDLITGQMMGQPLVEALKFVGGLLTLAVWWFLFYLVYRIREGTPWARILLMVWAYLGVITSLYGLLFEAAFPVAGFVGVLGYFVGLIIYPLLLVNLHHADARMWFQKLRLLKEEQLKASIQSK